MFQAQLLSQAKIKLQTGDLVKRDFEPVDDLGVLLELGNYSHSLSPWRVMTAGKIEEWWPFNFKKVS